MCLGLTLYFGKVIINFTVYVPILGPYCPWIGVLVYKIAQTFWKSIPSNYSEEEYSTIASTYYQQNFNKVRFYILNFWSDKLLWSRIINTISKNLWLYSKMTKRKTSITWICISKLLYIYMFNIFYECACKNLYIFLNIIICW